MIAIVTDSTAYITREDARALGVVVVPMTYSIGGHQLYTESYIGENGMFESLLKKNPPGQRTSQATMSAFMSTFEELRSAGHQVLCLTISSRLSGTYSNAAIAARELGGADISVVDSRTTAGGLFLMARAARRMIDEGMTLDQVTQRLKALRDKVKVIFSVEDMGPLRRSGRLGVVRLSVSTILNIKPILKCADGSVVSCGIARGRQGNGGGAPLRRKRGRRAHGAGEAARGSGADAPGGAGVGHPSGPGLRGHRLDRIKIKINSAVSQRRRHCLFLLFIFIYRTSCAETVSSPPLTSMTRMLWGRTSWAMIMRPMRVSTLRCKKRLSGRAP